MKVAIAQMYLEGVSTRRVQDITEKLCGYEISSTQVSRVTQELDGQFEQFQRQSSWNENRQDGSFSFNSLATMSIPSCAERPELCS